MNSMANYLIRMRSVACDDRDRGAAAGAAATAHGSPVRARGALRAPAGGGGGRRPSGGAERRGRVALRAWRVRARARPGNLSAGADRRASRGVALVSFRLLRPVREMTNKRLRLQLGIIWGGSATGGPSDRALGVTGRAERRISAAGGWRGWVVVLALATIASRGIGRLTQSAHRARERAPRDWTRCSS